MTQAISKLTALLLQQQAQSFPPTQNNTSSIVFNITERVQSVSGPNVLNETLPKKALQQPWVDLNANNMAWSEITYNDPNAHSKAQSKNEDEEQGEE